MSLAYSSAKIVQLAQVPVIVTVTLRLPLSTFQATDVRKK